MGNKLHVGNLAFSVNSEGLQQLFGQYGIVTSSKVIMDRDTGRSKGFAFVEMSSDEEANKVIDSLNGQDYEGRQLKISEAKPQAPREERGGFGGGGNRGGRY